MNTNDISYAPLKELAKEIFSGAPIYNIEKSSNSPDVIPLINIKDIVDGQIEFSSLSFLVSETINKPERFMVYPGDVIVTCRGTQLKIALVPNAIKKAIITANLIAIRVNEELSSLFLAAYLKTKEGQRALLTNATSTNVQLVLNVSDVGEVIIPVPPISLQEKIANLTNAAEEQHRLCMESANLYRTITNQVIMDTLNK